MTDKDSAGTAAELDEARRVRMTKADLRTVIELTRANAQMAAALRSVARWATDEKLTAAERINIIAHQPQVRAASQEAQPKYALDDEGEFINDPFASQEAPGHTDLMVAPESIDAFLEANPLPEEAPAAPAPEDGESEADYNRRCDDLILSIKAATPAPASNLLAPSAREDANPAPASPSPEAAASPKDVHIEHTLAASPSTGNKIITALEQAASGDAARVRTFRVAPASPSPGLDDPHTVHVNMLRGAIAKPTPAQIGHLYRGDEAKAVVAEVSRQNPDQFPASPSPGLRGCNGECDDCIARVCDDLPCMKFPSPGLAALPHP